MLVLAVAAPVVWAAIAVVTGWGAWYYLGEAAEEGLILLVVFLVAVVALGVHAVEALS
jgi:hypothetical protein